MRIFWGSVVALVPLGLLGPALGQEKPQETVKTFTYKKTKQVDLALYVHFPPDWKPQDRRPAIVFFFGGGFRTGSVDTFTPQAAYLAGRGMVPASFTRGASGSAAGRLPGPSTS